MKKFNVLGVNCRDNVEIEIFSKDYEDCKEFGFNAYIVFNDYTCEVRHNLTEFHHLFDGVYDEASAFESDIHMTGGTLQIDKIMSIIIVPAIYKNQYY